jgi:hypothetical protein
MTKVGNMTKKAPMDDLTMEEQAGAEDDRSPLLPDQHPAGDLFVCDIFGAAPKGDIASMAHPIFSLSTKPDLRIRRYEHGNDYVEITPSVKGLATVYDRDILIYCISQVISGLNNGRKIGQTLKIHANALLKATNRVTSGEGYKSLQAALERLAGTRISTNITTGNIEVFENFGLIENSEVVKQTREGRMEVLKIKLSDWVFNAIQAKEVLTLHRDYFKLRKPLEKRMYELARKHCGQQKQWSISMALLQKKCGSNSTPREFNRLVKNIIAQDSKTNHFPDYALTIQDNIVTFTNRGNVKGKRQPQIDGQPQFILDETTIVKARRAAPGYDIYSLHAEWVNWWRDGGSVKLKNPAGAFIGFCRNRHERAPLR